MNFDYSKSAYLKVEELSKRVAVLESITKAVKYDELNLSFNIYLKSSGTKTVVFRAIGEHKANIAITVNSLSVNCSVFINGQEITLTDGSADEETTVLNGDNKISFEFSGANSEWIEVTLTVSGYVENTEKAKRLSAVGGKYYSYLDDGTFYLYSTDQTNPIVALYSVKDASANYTSAGIFVSEIDDSDVLKIQRYYPDGTLYVETTADGKFSKCLVRVKLGYVALYAISGNYIKTGFVTFSGTTTLSRTPIRAKEITFRSVGNNDYILATDIDKSVYLLEISPIDLVSVTSRRSAGKIKSANLSYSGNDVAVWHNKGGAVVEKIYRDGAFQVGGTVAVADEAVLTDNGAKIIRVGNNLSIE